MTDSRWNGGGLPPAQLVADLVGLHGGLDALIEHDPTTIWAVAAVLSRHAAA